MKRPKSNDAELCRLKGWTAGTILRVESETNIPGQSWARFYRITAVGERSILVVSADPGPKGETEEQWKVELRSNVLSEATDEELRRWVEQNKEIRERWRQIREARLKNPPTE